MDSMTGKHETESHVLVQWITEIEAFSFTICHFANAKMQSISEFYFYRSIQNCLYSYTVKCHNARGECSYLFAICSINGNVHKLHAKLPANS